MGSDNGLDGEIPAGGTHSGLVAYQLPANAGDLLWIFQDFGQNRAIFAVKASDIDTSVGATMTALFGMVATADAADMTATAAP